MKAGQKSLVKGMGREKRCGKQKEGFLLLDFFSSVAFFGQPCLAPGTAVQDVI